MLLVQSILVVVHGSTFEDFKKILDQVEASFEDGRMWVEIRYEIFRWDYNLASRTA